MAEAYHADAIGESATISGCLLHAFPVPSRSRLRCPFHRLSSFQRRRRRRSSTPIGLSLPISFWTQRNSIELQSSRPTMRPLRERPRWDGTPLARNLRSSFFRLQWSPCTIGARIGGSIHSTTLFLGPLVFTQRRLLGPTLVEALCMALGIPTHKRSALRQCLLRRKDVLNQLLGDIGVWYRDNLRPPATHDGVRPS